MWAEKKKWKKNVDNKKIKIGVIGGGYVGINIASIFAKNGFNVTIFDINSEKVGMLNQGKNYITDEQWLNEIIKKSVKTGNLKASTNISEATKNDVIFIDVPTVKGKNCEPTSEFILNVCETIGKNLKRGNLIIVESSVIVGETENSIRKTLENRSNLKVGIDFGLAFSPERIDRGNKTFRIDNIPKVVGGIDGLSCELACYLLKKIINQIFSVSNCRTAEFVKLMELSQRASLLAHIFEMARIAEIYDIDIEEVIKAAKTKWNFVTVKPSCGVGGYCVGPSVKSLIKATNSKKYDNNFLKSVETSIESMPAYIVKKTLEVLNKKEKEIKNCKIGILGITYKANSSETRSSPVKNIITGLKSLGITKIMGYDPKCNNNVDWIKMTNDVEDIMNRDCIILCTDHDEFKNENFKKTLFEKIKRKNSILIDCRNVFADKKDPSIIGIGR